MKKKLSLILVACIICSKLFSQNIVVTNSGPAGVWQHLGTADVSFTMDHESIVITGTGEFRALKFKVADASVTILHMNFVYAKGRPDKLNVNYYIAADGESRIIDIRGGAKKIARVDFWYQSEKQDSGKIAKVSLWGMK
jgi:hypothetical protein